MFTFWADGIYCNVRMDNRQCLLVIIGATADGHKELVALEGGFRESEQSWLEILIDLKRRGLQQASGTGCGRWLFRVLESPGKGISIPPDGRDAGFIRPPMF